MLYLSVYKLLFLPQTYTQDENPDTPVFHSRGGGGGIKIVDYQQHLDQFSVALPVEPLWCQEKVYMMLLETY